MIFFEESYKGLNDSGVRYFARSGDFALVVSSRGNFRGWVRDIYDREPQQSPLAEQNLIKSDTSDAVWRGAIGYAACTFIYTRMP